MSGKHYDHVRRVLVYCTFHFVLAPSTMNHETHTHNTHATRALKRISSNEQRVAHVDGLSVVTSRFRSHFSKPAGLKKSHTASSFSRAATAVGQTGKELATKNNVCFVYIHHPKSLSSRCSSWCFVGRSCALQDARSALKDTATVEG